MKKTIPSLFRNALLLVVALAVAPSSATPNAAIAAPESTPARTPFSQVSVTVFAASSLKESLDAVALAWTSESGQHVAVSYAASSALARQIEKGAPADVFISADMDWMNYLQERDKLVAASRFNLAGNSLVLVAPTATQVRNVALNPKSVLRSLGKGRLAIAETSAVPAGRYARQALLATGVWDSVANRLAQADNVRAAMAFVALGEAPLGIVYATDARAEPRVHVVATFPASTHDRIVYPVARVAGRGNAALGFLAFLRTPAARAIFHRAGFSDP